MSRIEMWFDGGGPYGFGNVRRSAELAQTLIQRGHDVRCVPLSERAATLSPLPCSTEDGAAEIIVLDVPYPGDALVEKAHSAGARVLALDYDGEAAPELVISLQNVRRVPSQSRSRCGVEYAIIREEIHTLGTSHQSSQEVLIIVGGGDQDGLTGRILARLPDLQVCIVQGPAGSPLDLKREGLRIVTHPPDLPRLMARCAWAVTTGGTTMLEMLCLGKAIHVVPRTEAEQAFAQRFQDQGALLGLGLESLRPPTPECRLECEKRGPQLVDGKGCERIAIEIETSL